jgi:hypothetical protein
MGPIDYVVIEWQTEEPSVDWVPLVVDLVDRRIIRLLDVAFLAKGEDGTVASVSLEDIEQTSEAFHAFEGASSGLLADEDLQEAGSVLEPGSSAVVLVWENRWAAPVAIALRRSGGQLIASGRIPVQALLGALDASESKD